VGGKAAFGAGGGWRPGGGVAAFPTAVVSVLTPGPDVARRRRRLQWIPTPGRGSPGLHFPPLRAATRREALPARRHIPRTARTARTAPACEDHAAQDHAPQDHATEDHATQDHATQDHATQDHAPQDHAWGAPGMNRG